MREKIEEWLGTDEVSNILEHLDFEEVLTDKLFALIREEIEKVESSHMRLDNGYYVGFEECQQKILALFRPMENPVGSVDKL